MISLVAYLRRTNQAEAAAFATEAAGLDLPRTAGRSYHRATSNGAYAGNWSSRQHASGAGTAPSSAQQEDNKERASKLWAQGLAFKGTVGPAYLQSRGIDPSAVLDDELRIIPDLPYFSGTTPDGSPRKIGGYPAILAPIRDGLTGELYSVLRIWVDRGGNGKAPIVDPDTVGS